MEASTAGTDQQADPFAGSDAAASGDDPFAAAAPEEAVAESAQPEPDVQVEEAAPAADLPIVDKEGEAVNQTTEVQPNPHDQPAPPLSAAARSRLADEQSAAAKEEAAQPEAEEAPAQPPVEPQAPEETTPEPQPPVEPQAPAEAPVEPQEASGGGEPPSQPPTAAATEGGGGGGDDEQPEKAKQIRLYKLLYQTGPTTWEDTVIPDEYAEVVPDEKHGPQRFLKARNNDHARRLAFLIHDRPTAGVTIVPVPASSWKPKRVKAAPPKPDRERLEIE